MKKNKAVFFGIILFSALIFNYTFAQEAKTTEALTKQIVEAKETYFKEAKFSEFVEFLNSLKGKNKEIGPLIDYYTALARYSQLKYLEEKQVWDEYFDKGNDYKEELSSSAQKAIDATNSSDILNIHSRLLLWQFHADQHDVFIKDALDGLMDATVSFSSTARDAAPIKEIADKLLSYNEKSKARELYKIYIEKLSGMESEPEQLKDTALGFYNEGNLELAEACYDVYLGKISGSMLKEKLASLLRTIAGQFTSVKEKAKDPYYAEKIFERIDELGLEKAFDEETLYLRAYNLERAKDFQKAGEIYTQFCKQFPGSIYFQEASLKAGVISEYFADGKNFLQGPDIMVEPFRAKKAEEVKISTNAKIGESGCMPVELQYLWSGDLGKTKPTFSDSSFTTSYEEAGTKAVYLKIALPDGTFQRSLTLIDVD